MSTPILHRFPDSLLPKIEAWGKAHGEVNRTVAVNMLLEKALEADEMERMREEIDGLRKMVVNLATLQGRRLEANPKNHCLNCSLNTDYPDACNTCPWPQIDSRVENSVAPPSNDSAAPVANP